MKHPHPGARPVSWAVVFLLLLASTACGDTEATAPESEPVAFVLEADTEEPFRLGLGEVAALDEQRLFVRFEEVVAEGRCPEGVACVWAGSARIRLVVWTHPGSEVDVFLDTHRDLISSAVVGDHILHLEDVEPYPVYSRKPTFEEYVAVLRVEPGH